MKKILCISGIITVLLMSLLLTGMADADDAVKKALRQGNLQYASAEYEEALISYEEGLAASAENKDLNFNAAQTAYILGDYEKAAEYYGKSEDSTEKYLNFGNIFFRAGDADSDDSDVNKKIEYYAQALQIYREGIIKFPQDVPLKYNYEAVKQKLDELAQENKEQNKDDSSEGDDKQESQDENSEQGENSEQEQNSDQEQNSEQEQNSKQEQNSEQEQSSEQEQDSEQEQSSEQGQNEEQDQEEEQKAADSSEEGEEAEANQNREAIERILKMLESREEESLKNNQGIVSGKEGKNGW